MNVLNVHRCFSHVSRFSLVYLRGTVQVVRVKEKGMNEREKKKDARNKDRERKREKHYQEDL